MENERRFGNRFGSRDGGYGGGQRKFNRPFQPVKEGEELNAVIEAVAEKGDGIAKKSGFVIFVPGTKVGDKVKIRVKKVAKKVAFADVIGSYEEGGAQAADAPHDDGDESSGDDSSEEEQPEEEYDASQDSEEF